jgi:hypothetical protein
MNNLAGEMGDVFWDLPPWITYQPGSELGCTIYVANNADTEKEYALMSRLSSDDTVISEESIRVYGYAWFKVDPGDFIRLHGALKFDETDCTLSVLLIEREGETITDSVSTNLTSPTAIAGYPIGWPGGAGGTDMSWLLMLMMMFGLGMMMVSVAAPKEEEEKAVAPVEERKLLPARRYE